MRIKKGKVTSASKAIELAEHQRETWKKSDEETQKLYMEIITLKHDLKQAMEDAEKNSPLYC